MTEVERNRRREGDAGIAPDYDGGMVEVHWPSFSLALSDDGYARWRDRVRRYQLRRVVGLLAVVLLLGACTPQAQVGYAGCWYWGRVCVGVTP